MQIQKPKHDFNNMLMATNSLLEAENHFKKISNDPYLRIKQMEVIFLS